MDLYRRIGQGRLAEVVGGRALPADKVVRTLGIYRSAEGQYDELTDEAKATLEAYTKGVNAYIENHSGPYSPEFVYLLYSPEPWKPADSLVMGKLLALMLGGNWTGELRRAALLERLTPEQVEVLLPTSPDGPPIRTASLPATLQCQSHGRQCAVVSGAEARQ
jgi:penicillin amidase